MSQFVFKPRVDPDTEPWEALVYEIGFYTPDGKWIHISDTLGLGNATEEVRLLNGGNVRGLFS